MPDTLAPLDDLDVEITEALAELRGARADYAHSPNADSQLTVEYAELRLNKLIDRRTQGN
jgi:hypothetical protein